MGTGSVARVLGQRLAERVADYPSVLIEAPKEYVPVVLAVEVMTTLFGADGYDHLRVPQDLEAIATSVTTGRPLLMEVTTFEVTHLDGVTDFLEPLFEGFLTNKVMVVAEVDAMPFDLAVYNFHLHLDHRSLVVLPEELPRIHPEIQEQGTLVHHVMHATGGVPALVAEPDVTEPDYLERLVGICTPWAERNLELVRTDPLLELHMWTSRISSQALATTATRMFGRRVSPRTITALRENSMFTAAGPHALCLPEALAVAFQQLIRRDDRARVQQIEQTLPATVADDESIPAPERLRLLTGWGHWVGVDRLLSHHMHQLATLSPLQRAVYASQWPPQVPRQLVYLASARAFLVGDWDTGAVPPGTGTAWNELRYLLTAEGASHPDSLVERVRRRFKNSLSRRVYGVDAMREEVVDLVGWLGDEIHRIEGTTEGVSNCDSVLLVALLVGATDTAIRLGLMPEAQASVRRAMRLSQATQVDESSHPVMWPELLARAATLAAKGGLHHIAREHLDEYERVVVPLGPRDDDTDRLALIARRFLEPALDLRQQQSTPRIIEPALPFSAHAAEIEALRVLLGHGPDAALVWVRGFLTRAAWSSRPDWVWWPLFSFMALVEAREGRTLAARGWLERQPLPRSLDLIARASIEMAEGRHVTACALAGEALEEHDLSYRWRLLALGVKLACPEAPPNDLEIILASEDWSHAAGAVAMFHETARRRVESRLGFRLADLPGLAPAPPQVAEPAVVVAITPRQLDVLRALDSDLTMAQIADELSVGVETVRSTAKDMYRRLGVHGRTEAVALGRAQGLISPG